jgi:methylthioribose-1-phosphate isomerase
MPLPRTIEWIGDIDGFVRLIDQTQLPVALAYRDCRTVEEIWEAIRALRVRGAPAIGIAAAMGVVLGVQGQSLSLKPLSPGTPGERGWGEGEESRRNAPLTPNPSPLSTGERGEYATESQSDPDRYGERLRETSAYLRTSRPTAVNLFWALERMERCFAQVCRQGAPVDWTRRLLHEARAIVEEDRRMCRAIGAAGAPLVAEGQGVLTHCNAGGLATAEYGTALAVLFAAAEQGRRFQVYADETRPLLQGARLTAWELRQADIPVTLICDSMAAQVMKEGRIQLVVVGADRIAANGDTANKIGTYGVALLARAHGIPFYVAAPSSTFDLSLSSGAGIPIEQRDPREITHGFGRPTAPEGIAVYNPAFDVTPHPLITGIITEKGLIQPVSEQAIRATLAKPFVHPSLQVQE